MNSLLFLASILLFSNSLATYS